MIRCIARWCLGCGMRRSFKFHSEQAIMLSSSGSEFPLFARSSRDASRAFPGKRPSAITCSLTARTQVSSRKAVTEDTFGHFWTLCRGVYDTFDAIWSVKQLFKHSIQCQKVSYTPLCSVQTCPKVSSVTALRLLHRSWLDSARR